MKTTDLEVLISLYMDGELSEPMKHRVSHLIASNKQAAAIYQQFLQIRHIFQKTPRLTLSPDFTTDILSKIKKIRKNTPYIQKVSFFLYKRRTVIITTVSASVILLCLAPLFFMARHSSNEIATRQKESVVISTDAVAKQNEKALSQKQKETKTTEVASQTVNNSQERLQLPTIPLAANHATSTAVQEKRPYVLCQLKEEKSDIFYRQFQIAGSERGLIFTKSVRDGKVVLEYNLTQKQFQSLVRWLNKRTDYVQSVRVFGDLVQWQEKDSDLSSNDNVTNNTATTDNVNNDNIVNDATNSDDSIKSRAVRFEIETNDH